MRNLIFILRHLLFVFALAPILVSCETIQPGRPVPLQSFLTKNTVVSIPYERGKDGLIYLSVMNEDKEGRFVLDTGATRSAIFENSKLVAAQNRRSVGIANIFGLIETGTYPLIKTNNLSLGEQALDELAFALLPPYDDKNQPSIDGVLGMDLFVQYRLLIDVDIERIFLIENNEIDPDVTQEWIPVDLYGNPFDEKESRLHFFDLRVGSHIVPALLDTGSEINLINWNATVIPELKRMKRRLAEDWKLRGAVADFKPKARVNVIYLRAGQMRWEAHEFIVLDFDHLDSLGFADKPMVIGGYPLLAGRNIYFDFAKNKMWIRPALDSVTADGLN